MILHALLQRLQRTPAEESLQFYRLPNVAQRSAVGIGPIPTCLAGARVL
jgi:hypothetical protein